MPNDPYCARCAEEFPPAEPGTQVSMGRLYPLERFKMVPAVWRARSLEASGQQYICGNCYFDLTD